MSKLKSPLSLFLISVILIGLLALFGPEEKELGANVRVVYLHGAWVLAAEVAFLAAGIAGLLALVTKRDPLHNWSAAARSHRHFLLGDVSCRFRCGRCKPTGTDSSCVEPRFRLALIFAVTGVLLQIGLWLINMNWVTSLGERDLYSCPACHLCRRG
ncbi:MAG: hypothetical protein MZU91_02000 [Desulfosudis oleivorans]|nr:hypothetical protein [Desulfosudis oleivorans]